MDADTIAIITNNLGRVALAIDKAGIEGLPKGARVRAELAESELHDCMRSWASFCRRMNELAALMRTDPGSLEKMPDLSDLVGR